MSSKTKNTILNIIITLLLIILIYCLYSIGSILYTKNKAQTERIDKVETFKQDIVTQQEVTTEENENKYDPFEKIEGKTVGLLFTNIAEMPEATLVYQDIFDDDGVYTSLKSNVVMYTNYGGIGIPGSNTVMSAHSSIYECDYCYFNELEEYKQDDIIEILWNNKKIYKYKVTDVLMNQDPEAAWYYEQPEDNSQEITLMTCTDGKTAYRTVVKAKLFEIADWRNN